MGNNVAHLESKLETFENYLKNNKPAAFMLQETKMKRVGQIKTETIKEYIVYELLRKKEKTKGGGLAIGILKSLQPAFINEGDDEVEALTVEVWVEDFPVRLVVAYGPQNSDRDNDSKKHKTKKEKFWTYIENEFIEAKRNGAGFLVQMDGNLHAGKEIVPNDPNPINDNGELFKSFLQRNKDITVCNSLETCEGLITRYRKTVNSVQRAVLDFFLCCNRLRPFIKKMKIDEDGEIALTNLKPAKEGNKAKPSDHAVLEIEFNLKFSKEKPERIEVFNFKNKVSQVKFFQQTSNTKCLSNCFKEDGQVNKQTIKWWSKLNSIFHQTFKKIRINAKKNKEETDLDKKMNEWKTLKRNNKIEEKDGNENVENKQK